MKFIYNYYARHFTCSFFHRSIYERVCLMSQLENRLYQSKMILIFSIVQTATSASDQVALDLLPPKNEIILIESSSPFLCHNDFCCRNLLSVGSFCMPSTIFLSHLVFSCTRATLWYVSPLFFSDLIRFSVYMLLFHFEFNAQGNLNVNIFPGPFKIGVLTMAGRVEPFYQDFRLCF